MYRIRKFLRYLARPPDMKGSSHEVKVFFQQLKTAPRKSVIDSFRRFLRYFSVWMKRRKTNSQDEKRSKPPRWFSYSLKRRSVEVEKPKGLSLAKHLLKRSQKIPKEESKPPHIWIKTLKVPPKLDMQTIMRSLHEKWIHLKFLLMIKTKTDDKEVPANTVAITFRKDLIEFKQKLALYYAIAVSAVNLYWKKTILALIMFPIVFELLLQMTSLFGWSLLELRFQILPAASKERVILCVGDFITSGKSTSIISRPYSDFLHTSLKKHSDLKWKVLNFSSEYLNSQDVIQSMPRLLQNQHPDVIYLMIGINDLLPGEVIRNISLPEKRETSLAKSEWLRTGVLFRAWKERRFMSSLPAIFTEAPIFLKEKPVTQTESEADFSKLWHASFVSKTFPMEGTWYYSGKPALFSKQGKVTKNGTQTNFSIRNNVYLENHNGNIEAQLWELDGKHLIFTGEDITSIRLYAKSPLDKFSQRDYQIGPNYRAGWDFLKIYALDLAEKEFERALTTAPKDAVLHSGLAEVYFNLGSHHLARGQIAWLLNEYRSEPNLRTARALLYAFPFENSAQQTLNLTKELLTRYPGDPWLWNSFARCNFLLGSPGIARQAISRASELIPAEMAGLKASILRSHAEMIVALNPEASLRKLVEAYLLDGNESLLVDSLLRDGSRYTSIHFNQLLTDLPCPEDKKEMLVSLYYETLDDEMISRLHLFQTRLEQIAKLCHEYDAQIVLVTYPVPAQRQIERITKIVAEETDASWLNLSPRFDRLLKTPKAWTKYMKDGRLTDAAIHQIADWIAYDAQSRIAY